VKAFEDKMKRAFDAADIMISRSGASSVSEIIATGKPAILVPFPFATDNHQFYNAKYLADRDAAEILEDRNMTIGSLFSKLENLVRNEERRKQLSESSSKLHVRDSAERMAKTVLELARQGEK
jgi:UDP-N-acetylglucosamine--N-acetylmuramyl-(pentapeptide) pyrophosphoryl-undecaprenol N-acetylglucosamine transferase